MAPAEMEIVRGVFEAAQAGLEQGDIGAVFDSGHVANDAEWIPAAEIPGAGSYRGRDGFVEFMSVWVEDFDRFSIELERLIDAGEGRVVALAFQRAVGKASGAPVELHFAQVYELDGGRVVRIHNHLHPAEALESVGLSD